MWPWAVGISFIATLQHHWLESRCHSLSADHLIFPQFAGTGVHFLRSADGFLYWMPPRLLAVANTIRPTYQLQQVLRWFDRVHCRLSRPYLSVRVSLAPRPLASVILCRQHVNNTSNLIVHSLIVISAAIRAHWNVVIPLHISAWS